MPDLHFHCRLLGMSVSSLDALETSKLYLLALSLFFEEFPGLCPGKEGISLGGLVALEFLVLLCFALEPFDTGLEFFALLDFRYGYDLWALQSIDHLILCNQSKIILFSAGIKAKLRGESLY